MSIYLDYNSSAPIDSRVLDFMIDVYRNTIGNADSRTHDFGNHAREITEAARGRVAELLGIQKNEVFFTSGATESNNIALSGLRDYGLSTGKKHIVTSSIEHKAVLETAKHLALDGFEVDFIDPDSSGRVAAEKILSAVRDDTLLVSLMHVNNETGIIQPVLEVGEALAKCGVLFHIDATQSFGKLVEELRTAKYDMLSMSAHKISGPQGVGALVLRRRSYKLPPVKPIMYGGQQEHGLRPGTTPVALVAGLGKACEIAFSEYTEVNAHCRMIKERILSLIESSGVDCQIIGDQEHCVSSTLNVCFPGVSAEALMLSSKQYCGISNGSACNSNAYTPSYVLSAMGLSESEIECCVRISWGFKSDIDEVAESISNLLDVVKALAF